ncbi:charged multivesicular body protein 2a isoform X2 [Myotis lucifugus]|uniref:charged multivesicular body protein 2a isoform X2 n=1 Tax=Myotis lucifugus TaxID=59463 RepID=UPI000CCC32E3|nr:charged multivesicular body protein 2a isoform X2 [Myotis lucifugus]
MSDLRVPRSGRGSTARTCAHPPPVAGKWEPARMRLGAGQRQSACVFLPPPRLPGVGGPVTSERLIRKRRRRRQRRLNRGAVVGGRSRDSSERLVTRKRKRVPVPASLKLPQIQKIMMEFERQAEIMDMKEEMMNDAIDDAMGDEEDEEESDAVVSQVLDELGLSLTDELSNLPSTGGSLSVAAGGKKAEAAASASALVDADADLEERLKNLRRD